MGVWSDRRMDWPIIYKKRLKENSDKHDLEDTFCITSLYNVVLQEYYYRPVPQLSIGWILPEQICVDVLNCSGRISLKSGNCSPLCGDVATRSFIEISMRSKYSSGMFPFIQPSENLAQEWSLAQ